MRTLIRRTKALGLLQLILVLPPLMSGSVCISMDGTERLEPGFCACIMAPAGTAETAIGAAEGAECGPCWDVAVHTLRTARVPFPYAPAMASSLALPGPAAIAPPSTRARVIWIGEPPGKRLSILRC